MGHDHHGHHHHHADTKNLLLAFTLNACFAVIEFIGGYITNSVAIYSDALHDLGDSLALLFAYFSEKISHKEADDKFTFGYRRFSILSAFINGLILLLGSFYVIYEAIKRLANPEPVMPEGMFLLAILGILVNGFAAFRLSKSEGINSRMVMLHLLEDLLGWAAVLILSIVLYFYPLYELDAILSILISFVILKGVYKNLIKVGMIFLQTFPSNLDIDKIKNEVRGNKLVEDIHAVKGWSIDSESYYLRFHIAVPAGTTIESIDDLKIEIKNLLKTYKVKYSTIEFESSKCS